MFELFDHLIICHVAQIYSSTIQYSFIPANGHLGYVSGLASVQLKGGGP